MKLKFSPLELDDDKSLVLKSIAAVLSLLSDNISAVVVMVEKILLSALFNVITSEILHINLYVIL